MKTLQILEKRLKSKTPPFLKKLRNFFLGVSAGVAGALGFMLTYQMQDSTLFTILTYIGVATAFAVPILSLATTDPDISQEA